MDGAWAKQSGEHSETSSNSLIRLKGVVQGDAARQGVVVFTVPEDRWLIVTDVAANSSITNLVERRGAEEIEKPFNPGVQSTVGVTFTPGSQVVVRTDRTGPLVYDIIGYLTD